MEFTQNKFQLIFILPHLFPPQKSALPYELLSYWSVSLFPHTEDLFNSIRAPLPFPEITNFPGLLTPGKNLSEQHSPLGRMQGLQMLWRRWGRRVKRWGCRIQSPMTPLTYTTHVTAVTSLTPVTAVRSMTCDPMTAVTTVRVVHYRPGRGVKDPKK